MSAESCCSDPEIDLWLKKEFGKKEIPLFDETPEFLERVRLIMMKNKEAERDSRKIIETKRRLITEYDKKAEELSRLTEMIHLTPETEEKVEKLASAAAQLRLKAPTFTNFILAISDLENEEMKIKEEELVNNFNLLDLQEKISETKNLNEDLKKSLEQLSEEKKSIPKMMEDVKTLAEFLSNKMENYQKKVRTLEKILKERSVEPSIYHKLLLQKDKDYQQILADMKTLEIKIEYYKQLPPNEELARLKVSQAREKVRDLKAEFQELLDTSIVKEKDSETSESLLFPSDDISQTSASEKYSDDLKSSVLSEEGDNSVFTDQSRITSFSSECLSD